MDPERDLREVHGPPGVSVMSEMPDAIVDIKEMACYRPFGGMPFACNLTKYTPIKTSAQRTEHEYDL
jgi:hypothetical protein